MPTHTATHPLSTTSKQWRRLRGVVDARKLPSRWYCSMNKTDPDRARCSAPEEEYESATTPESAMGSATWG